ncbi:hypothetical protein M595_5766 [Lyngbya aestuarii BL J]|uniref:Uncharacterized protein n=1 Tax=Lyngbya aestuarii BL J TaxID=1348334 RepID=U7Q930_9CYAN|nr:hypothetical protein [Lyngbya aestuarii]ERT04293.1 hypothetical protein M595_5766 [Lyngbya aestuarii BL J]
MNQFLKLTEQQFKLLTLIKSKPGMNLTEILDEIAEIYEEFPDGGAVKAKLYILEEKELIRSQLVTLYKKRRTRRYYSQV